MNVTWQKAKNGAKWLGIAGLIIGATMGGIAGAVGIGLPGLIIGAATGALEYGLIGAVAGGSVGGLWEVLSSDTKTEQLVPPAKATKDRYNAAPSFNEELSGANRSFQQFVEKSRDRSVFPRQI